MSESLFAVALEVAGVQMTWLELVAVLLSLAMVACNIREIHWGWPLAILSSALYLALFWHAHLYGSALLQGVFIAAALWGWLQWLRPVRSADGTGLQRLAVSTLSRRQGVLMVLAWLALWLLTGLLMRQSDSPAPWWDAFVTAGSLIGQYLLGRKHLQNWIVWLVVNVFSVALYASQALWPTAVLYAVFAALSVAGWRVWRAQVAPATQGQPA